jgi:hypothetical protein
MSEEFSAGVNILLQRMETHPEEFYDAQSRGRISTDPKWHGVVVSVLQMKFKESARGEGIFFTEAEVDALYAGYSKIRRKAFDDYVMDTVLNPKTQLSSDATTLAKMQSLQGQYGWSDPSNIYTGVAQAKDLHLAAQQQALMNAYPYHISQDPHPQPMPEGMLSRISKGLGLK